MHIGAGAFHRAHQAWYLNQLIAQGDDSWHISLGNVRNDGQEMMAQLAAQHGEYILETVTPEGERRYEKITSVNKIVVNYLGGDGRHSGTVPLDSTGIE